MGVVSLHGFRTEPGRLADHMAASAEGLGHLRRLGLQAVTIQALAGGDVGTIATVVNYADHAGHTAAVQQVLGDEQWQEFWGRVNSDGSSRYEESAVFEDLDPDHQPSPDRPMGVLMAVQWRPHPGRFADFLENVIEAVPHIERLGGAPRAMQSLIGAHPVTVMFSTTFADLDAYGAYADRVARDGEFQAFWQKVMADPTAEPVRSGLYLNISDQLLET